MILSDAAYPVIKGVIFDAVNPYFGAISRYFRRNKGPTDHATIPTVTLAGDFSGSFEFSTVTTDPVMTFFSGDVNNISEIVIDILDNGSVRLFSYSSLGDLQGVATAIGPFNDGKLHKADFSLLGTTASLSIDGGTTSTVEWVSFDSAVIYNLYRRSSGGNKLSGILANLKIYDNGTPIRNYPLNEPKGTSVIYDIVGGNNGTIVNGDDEDKGLFTKQANGDWLGQELVVNGGFDSDSGWSKSAGVIINGGVALYDVSSNQNMNQPFVGVAGSVFIAKMNVKSFNAGNIQFSIDGGVGPKWSAVGSYSVELTTTGANSKLFIPADFSAGFNGSIDNVSVKELLKSA